MGKFEMLAGSKILQTVDAPNLRGKWHVHFNVEFMRNRGEYIARIRPHRFKLAAAADGRILNNARGDRRHDFFIKTAVGTNILGKTMVLEFDGKDFIHIDLKYKVVEVGSAGGTVYDYALLELADD